ncbi:hypothetical protein Hanom_Chr02g00158041 [Helianthus anomalus]
MGRTRTRTRTRTCNKAQSPVRPPTPTAMLVTRPTRFKGTETSFEAFSLCLMRRKAEAILINKYKKIYMLL